MFPRPDLGDERSSRPIAGVWQRRCASLCIVVALALTVAACGKRGDPQLPEGKTDEFPRQYPDPSSL
jgi:hypothetical protein